MYKATEDPKTGGISFLPKTRKTPISFDGRRHKLVERTPEELSDYEGKEKPEQDFVSSTGKSANHQKKRAISAYSRRVKKATSDPSEGANKEIQLPSADEDAISARRNNNFKLAGLVSSSSTPETIISSDEEKQSTVKQKPTKRRKHAKRSQVSLSNDYNDWRVRGAIDW